MGGREEGGLSGREDQLSSSRILVAKKFGNFNSSREGAGTGCRLKILSSILHLIGSDRLDWTVSSGFDSSRELSSARGQAGGWEWLRKDEFSVLAEAIDESVRRKRAGERRRNSQPAGHEAGIAVVGAQVRQRRCLPSLLPWHVAGPISAHCTIGCLALLLIMTIKPCPDSNDRSQLADCQFCLCL